jgi:excisionase family DNA binding protein
MGNYNLVWSHFQERDSALPFDVMNDERLLTLEQAAERLGMKPVTLRMWASARKIARVKINRAVRIPESEITKIIERGLIPARPERSR